MKLSKTAAAEVGEVFLNRTSELIAEYNKLEDEISADLNNADREPGSRSFNQLVDERSAVNDRYIEVMRLCHAILGMGVAYQGVCDRWDAEVERRARRRVAP